LFGVPSPIQASALCAHVVRLLKEEREQRGLSKYAISQRSGISQPMVGYVERGLRNPTLETLLRMADAVGVELEDVLRKARRASGKSGRE
jgi:transcriptional regulator with XRE-family HTH domain